MECQGCYYNRPLIAWGELIPNACWFTHDNPGKELYHDDSKSYECSGYEPMEKQLELVLEG